MKKYRLLFDTPWNKKGEVFEERSMVQLVEAIPFGSKPGVPSQSYSPDLLPDWFEEVIPERWKPEKGEVYWVVNTDGRVVLFRYEDDSVDRGHFKSSNFFQYKPQAKEAALRVKATLLAYQEELLNKEV